jgi:hypothetical protein
MRDWTLRWLSWKSNSTREFTNTEPEIDKFQIQAADDIAISAQLNCHRRPFTSERQRRT